MNQYYAFIDLRSEGNATPLPIVKTIKPVGYSASRLFMVFHCF